MKKAVREEAKSKGAKGKVGRKSGRNMDASGSKSKKQTSRQLLKAAADKKRREEEDKEEEGGLDFGEDSDEDEDEDFGEERTPGKSPWGKKSEAMNSDDDVLVARAYDDPPMGFDELQSSQLVLKRDTLKKWVHEPYFMKALGNSSQGGKGGCFVKLNIGKKDGVTYYRLCEVVSVREVEKVYAFPLGKGEFEVTKTNLRLELAFGENVSVFAMDKVTNEVVTVDDFLKWTEAMKTGRKTIPTGKECRKRSKALKKLVTSHYYTPEEIEATIALKRKYAPNRILNIALEMDKITNEILKHETIVREAEATVKRLQDEHPDVKITASDLENAADASVDGDESEAAQVARKEIVGAKIEIERSTQRLVDLRKEESNAKFQGEARVKAKGANAKVSGMDKVNQRNYQDNKSRDYNAFVALDLKEQEAKVRGAVYNPFARLPNKPKNLWDVGQEEDLFGVEKERPKAAVKVAAQVETMERPISPDLTAEGGIAHQFNMSEDDIARARAAAEEKARVARSAKEEEIAKAQGSRERKGISFGDYLKRKGKVQ